MAFFSSDQLSGISSGFGVAGFGLGIAGALESSQGAQKKAAAQRYVAQLEMQADQQRRQAMEISARRQQLQTVRTAQQSRAMALSTAVGQGSQFSSSAIEGQAQTGSQAAYANLGVSQNLQIGENLFNINQNIDAAKMTEADAETQIAQGQGLSSLGGSLGKIGGPFSNLLSLIPGG